MYPSSRFSISFSEDLSNPSKSALVAGEERMSEATEAIDLGSSAILSGLLNRVQYAIARITNADRRNTAVDNADAARLTTSLCLGMRSPKVSSGAMNAPENGITTSKARIRLSDTKKGDKFRLPLALFLPGE